MLLWFILSLCLGLSPAFAADYYAVPYGTHLRITEHAVCKSVFNNSPSGNGLFVPTKTSGEWLAFLGNLPTGVNAGECSMLGSGGTLTVDGLYNIHTYTTSGNFIVSGADGYIEILIVGGGGGGGGRHGGGGGGGGILYGGITVSAGTYAVVVGTGGGVASGASLTIGGTGGASVFAGTYIARGGGGGGSYTAKITQNGGSGGGGGGVGPATAGTCNGCAENRNPGPATQTNIGTLTAYMNIGGSGAGPGVTANMTGGGGGGGAGAVGSIGTGNIGGPGGNGRQFSISGTATYYGGGGGGGSGGAVANVAAGGLGGGGAGGDRGGPGTAGTANTGGGGGGARSDAPNGSTSSQGGAGGSGIVIIRYLTP